jgi:hypothetical protein
MSIETRLSAALNLLWQISQMIGWSRLSDHDDDTFTPEEQNIVRRLRSNTERGLSSEIVNIIHSFLANNQSMTDAELMKISEEITDKWGFSALEFDIYENHSMILVLSLDLFQVMETLLHDFPNSENLLRKIETVNQNFITYTNLMKPEPFQHFVRSSIVEMKETVKE